MALESLRNLLDIFKGNKTSREYSPNIDKEYSIEYNQF